MAHKKAQWSTSNGRDSNAKRLGIKLFWGQKVIAGNIIVLKIVLNQVSWHWNLFHYSLIIELSYEPFF